MRDFPRIGRPVVALNNAFHFEEPLPVDPFIQDIIDRAVRQLVEQRMMIPEVPGYHIVQEFEGFNAKDVGEQTTFAVRYRYERDVPLPAPTGGQWM